MRFRVHAQVWPRFPGLLLPVAVARGLDNARARPEVEDDLTHAWRRATAGFGYPNPQSHPAIKAWRDAFTALGISGKQFPSSAEALLRRALKSPEPLRINPLVDAYNAVSLRHRVPAGAFDLAAVDGDLHLRLTEEGELFLALGAGEPERVAAGEVAYTDDRAILTRHFVWRQAEQAKITPQTRDVFLVAEVLGVLGRPVAEAVLADLARLLEDSFGVEPQLGLVREKAPELAL